MRVVVAPVPGTIRDIFVKPGEQVSRGQILFGIEVMQMTQHVSAPADGTIRLLLAKSGEQVHQGALLAELEL
jgi:3-methylcrotonyl-CoA carboxylase alpha subunit